MISRRALLVSALLVVMQYPLDAQQMRPPRIGVLAQDLQPGLLETFSDELRKLGYVEGNAISIEVRNAAGQNERLPGLAKELLQLNVEVIQMEQVDRT